MAERFLEPSALFGQSLAGNFVLARALVKESISSTVTEPVTNELKKPISRLNSWLLGFSFSLSMSSVFGVLFRVTTWGESHGGGVGAVVDGCPPRIPLTAEEIQVDLNRRRPGQSAIVSPRDEEDKCQILSGVFEGLTLGTPISVMVWNKDARPEAYREMERAFRPSHADYTYQAKYGIRNWQGGGRASARETIGRVAAAAIAKQVLHQYFPEFEVVAYVKSVHRIDAEVDPDKVEFAAVEASMVRCPDPDASARMIELIKTMRKEGNSVGGSDRVCCPRGSSRAWRAGF